MGLFGFGKKKQGNVAEELHKDADTAEKEHGGAHVPGAFWSREDFAFEIQKVLAYKEQGSLLVGRAHAGQLLPDTKVSYVDRGGRAVFNCVVSGMEQNGMKVKKASACQFGLYGPTFTLVIPDFAPNAFAEGNFLYQKAEEGAQLSPLMEAFEGCRLSKGREEEIRAAMDGQLSENHGDGQDGAPEEMKQICKDYSVQEMIFALTHARDAANRAKAENRQEEEARLKEKSEALYQTMLGKLRALDEVYLTIDKNTNYPFFNNGFVDVYTKEEYAQMAVLFYKEQFRELEVRAMPVTSPKMQKPEEGKPLAAQMPAFVLLYYLGMERVLVDNGLYRAALLRGDVLPPPDFSGKPAAAVPVTNPALRLRILDFFGEARWKVNYEKRGQVLQAKEHAMLTEVAKAKFIIPMKYEGAAQPKPGMNQIVFNKDTKLMFAALKNTAGESYTPIFTDFAELGKMYQPKDWGAAVISVQDAISINKGDGIAINPAGENLVLKEKAINAVREIIKQLKEQAAGAAAQGGVPGTTGQVQNAQGGLPGAAGQAQNAQGGVPGAAGQVQNAQGGIPAAGNTPTAGKSVPDAAKKDADAELTPKA